MDEEFALTWGADLHLPYEQDKRMHVQALQHADRGDIEPLIRYATS